MGTVGTILRLAALLALGGLAAACGSDPADTEVLGDPCEDVDLLTDSENCGSCGSVCADDTECIDGMCLASDR